MPAQQDPAIEMVPLARLRPYPGNARTHSKKQVRQIAESIRRFGFTNPVLIGQDDEIIAGHGRVAAARLIGLASVPVLRLSHLDATQRRAYALADNKLALNADWDAVALVTEFEALADIEFDLDLTGFSLAEVDFVLGTGAAARPACDGTSDRAPGAAAAAPRERCLRDCRLLRGAGAPRAEVAGSNRAGADEVST